MLTNAYLRKQGSFKSLCLMKIHIKGQNQSKPHMVWQQKCDISIKISLLRAKICQISTSSPQFPSLLKRNCRLSSGSFIYYVINVYVPRVRANAYHVLTTPPRVFRDPKMCLRNIWTAPYPLSNISYTPAWVGWRVRSPAHFVSIKEFMKWQLVYPESCGAA